MKIQLGLVMVGVMMKQTMKAVNLMVVTVAKMIITIGMTIVMIATVLRNETFVVIKLHHT